LSAVLTVAQWVQFGYISLLRRKNIDFTGVLFGGASRDRTDDLIVANLTVYRLPACIFNSLEATLVHYWFNPKAEGVFAMNKNESVLLQMQGCGNWREEHG
jgi:hypothetical protein